MQHTTGSFTARDGLTIYTESWLPDSPPRAVVLIVHGLGEHIGRYAHVAPHMVEAGYAVYGLDHRSHGKSGGADRAHFDRFDDVLVDLKQFFDSIKAAQPGLKIFLYGHSLGSIITLAFTLRHQSEIAGILISGTPLDLDTVQPALLLSVAAVLNSIVPKAAITPPLPAETLSRDPAVVQAYDADPLVYHGKVRISIGHQIISTSRDIKARLREFTLPIYIFHGTDDKICPPRGSQTLYDGVASTDKTLKFYEGLRHETHNEPEQAEVIANMINWLNAR